MRIRIFKSLSEFNAEQASCKFVKCRDPYIKIEDKAYSYVVGDASGGKLIMLQVDGSLQDMREHLSLMRLKKGERMMLRVCAQRNVTMQELDRIMGTFSQLAYDCVYGVALFEDMTEGEFNVDAIIKYEPQSELRL